MLFLKIVANNTWYYIINKRAYYLSILLLISFNIMIIYFLINFGMDIIFIIISFLFFLILIFFTLGLKKYRNDDNCANFLPTIFKKDRIIKLIFVLLTLSVIILFLLFIFLILFFDIDVLIEYIESYFEYLIIGLGITIFPFVLKYYQD